MEYMTQSYYTVANGKSAIDFIYEYNLEFARGNCVKYLIRAGRKDNNSAESDLNKALVYISSANKEVSFLEKIFRRIYNTLTFDYSTEFVNKDMDRIIKSVIKFDDPNKIATMIVNYMDNRGINVKPEFDKYRK